MAVALLALFISLSGTAVAARVLITSSAQIKAGTVNSGDVKDKSLKLKDFALAERTKLMGATGRDGPRRPDRTCRPDRTRRADRPDRGCARRWRSHRFVSQPATGAIRRDGR
jgi:hypothetical protein